MATRHPTIPQQGTFGPRDARFVAQSVPPYAAATSQRVAAGLAQRGGILPRALHSLNNRQDPSRLGAIVAQRQGFDAVMYGFHGVAGLNGSGCTSTGGQIAQGTLAAGGTLLTSMSPALTSQQVASGTSSTLPAGSGTTTTTATKASTATAITGGILSAVSAIYTGVCTARTGTQQPAVTTGSQVGAVAGQLITDITAARTAGSTSATPSAATAASTAAATNPNSGDAAAAAMSASVSGDKTLLYVGIGAVALVGVALVLRK